MILDIRIVARALGGDMTGPSTCSVPGPGHGPADRSLSIRLSVESRLGFICHSHSGDDWAACRDYVADRLNLRNETTTRRRDVSHVRSTGQSRPDEVKRRIRAIELWAEGVNPIGTVVERYLNGRGIELAEDLAGRVIRFHGRCPWTGDDGKLIRVRAMLTVMRDVGDNSIRAVQRTWLSDAGMKIDRRMLGPAAGAAVKLDADEDVTHGLHIGEGGETVMAGRQLGLQPAWALGSAGAIAAFPVLPGIEALTLFAETDATSRAAILKCAARWHSAGREVSIIGPNSGSDLADVVRGAA